jgi:hypothetical protein
MTTSTKALRADAQRNYDALLAAGKSVFGRFGVDADRRDEAAGRVFDTQRAGRATLAAAPSCFACRKRERRDHRCRRPVGDSLGYNRVVAPWSFGPRTRDATGSLADASRAPVG